MLFDSLKSLAPVYIAIMNYTFGILITEYLPFCFYRRESNGPQMKQQKQREKHTYHPCKSERLVGSMNIC